MNFQMTKLVNLIATKNTYNKNFLQVAAIAINELGCLAYPIVIKQAAHNRYTIVGNDFYYHAVIRAVQLGGKFDEVPTILLNT
jgi:hypothetical protein